MLAPKLWYPERWCERYLKYCSPPFDGPPHYPKAPPRIVVVDSAASHLTGDRLGFWRKARGMALNQWKWGGLVLPVREGVTPYRRGRVTIDVAPISDSTRGQAFFGMDPDDENVPLRGVGWALVDDTYFEQMFAARTLRPLAGVLCHEFGHTLGFGQDDSPISGGTMTPKASGAVSQEEIDAMRSYWFDV